MTSYKYKGITNFKICLYILFNRENNFDNDWCKIINDPNINVRVFNFTISLYFKILNNL